MWTHSWPRRRISSATRCGVITSRRLPRWIGPEGLSPDAATIGRPGARRCASATTSSANRDTQSASVLCVTRRWCHTARRAFAMVDRRPATVVVQRRRPPTHTHLHDTSELLPWHGNLIHALRRRLADLAALATYLGLAGYLTAGLWRSPDRRALSFLDGADELLLQWYLAHAAHAVTHLGNPFFTTDMNMPAGVNLAANASVLGLGVPLTPVTLLFGAGVTTCLVVLGSLAGTALAWYWLLSRKLRLHRGAALVGGLFCGFAPPLVLESAYGHQHIAAQFLVPLIAWRFVRLAAGRPVRDGLIFGALVAYQALIGE